MGKWRDGLEVGPNTKKESKKVATKTQKKGFDSE